MYFKLKKGCFIRQYGEYGYITSTGTYNDQVFNQGGSVFLSELSRDPRSLDELAERISRKFADVSKDDIMDDARTFFENLTEDGFTVSGQTAAECEKMEEKRYENVSI